MKTRFETKSGHIIQGLCALVFCAALCLLVGCEPEEPPKPPFNWDNGRPPPPRTDAAHKKVMPDSGDYFPLAVGNAWAYRVRMCYTPEPGAKVALGRKKICTRQDILTRIVEKRNVQGKEVYFMAEGGDENKLDQSKDAPREKPAVSSKGYMDDGEYVYQVFVEGGKITSRSIAGRHDLKPGDAWEKEFAGDGTAAKLECGEPKYVHLPLDERVPVQYKVICCHNGTEITPGGEDYYEVCYTADLGRVAEYAPGHDVQAEILPDYKIK